MPQQTTTILPIKTTSSNPPSALFLMEMASSCKRNNETEQNLADSSARVGSCPDQEVVQGEATQQHQVKCRPVGCMHGLKPDCREQVPTSSRTLTSKSRASFAAQQLRRQRTDKVWCRVKTCQLARSPAACVSQAKPWKNRSSHKAASEWSF
jgi:hypothetical protein